MWFPLPLPKLVSLTVKNPSKGLSFYSAPCKNKLINMALLGIMTQKSVIFAFLAQKYLKAVFFSLNKKIIFRYS